MRIRPCRIPLVEGSQGLGNRAQVNTEKGGGGGGRRVCRGAGPGPPGRGGARRAPHLLRLALQHVEGKPVCVFFKESAEEIVLLLQLLSHLQGVRNGQGLFAQCFEAAERIWGRGGGGEGAGSEVSESRGQGLWRWQLKHGTASC